MSVETLILKSPEARIKTVIDMGAYKDLTPDVREAFIAHDYARVFTEAAEAPLWERITPYEWHLLPDGRVIEILDGKTDEKDISEKFSLDPQYLKETEAALDMRRKFIEKPIGTLLIWISPPVKGKYPEGRISVGHSKGDALECYGIPTQLSPDNHLSIALHLSEFSEENYSFENPESLVSQIISIKLSPEANPWMFLKGHIPFNMDKVWESILQKLPQKNQEKMLEKSRPVARKVSMMVENARTNIDFIRAGAFGEQRMLAQGLKVLGKPCDLPWNSQILANYSISITPFGPRLVYIEGGWHPGECIDPGCKHKGEVIIVGPCNLCKDCEKKYN